MRDKARQSLRGASCPQHAIVPAFLFSTPSAPSPFSPLRSTEQITFYLNFALTLCAKKGAGDVAAGILDQARAAAFGPETAEARARLSYATPKPSEVRLGRHSRWLCRLLVGRGMVCVTLLAGPCCVVDSLIGGSPSAFVPGGSSLLWLLGF